jgi:hypothetical protein
MFQSPTRMVWVLARVHVRDDADFAFFERFVQLTVANPLVPPDSQFISDVLDSLGLPLGQPKPWVSIEPSNRQALTQAFCKGPGHPSP